MKLNSFVVCGGFVLTQMTQVRKNRGWMYEGEKDLGRIDLGIKYRGRKGRLG